MAPKGQLFISFALQVYQCGHWTERQQFCLLSQLHNSYQLDIEDFKVNQQVSLTSLWMYISSLMCLAFQHFISNRLLKVLNMC